MSFTTRLSLLISILAITIFSGCAAKVGAGADLICAIIPDQGFPGSGPLSGFVVAVPKVIPYDFSDFPDLTAYERDIKLESITFTAVSGISNFDFIEGIYAKLSADDSASALPSVEVIDYSKDSSATVESPLVLKSVTKQNLSAYYDAKKVKIEMTLTGAAPKDAWTMDVTVCFSVTAGKKLF